MSSMPIGTALGSESVHNVSKAACEYSSLVQFEKEETTPTSKMEAEKSDDCDSSTGSVNSQWTKVLTFAGYASTLGSALPAGYCIGVMNSPAIQMRAWCNATLVARYDLQLSNESIELLWAAIVSIFLIGGAIGSLTGAGAANRFGRRSCYFICAFLFLMGAGCFYTCRMLSSVELLLIGRFLVGLASGLTTACLPMYHSEIASPALRGTLAVFCAVGLTAGVVVGQIFSLQSIFGGPASWHIALSFYALFIITAMLPYGMYPESPKWLYIIKGRSKQAQIELQRLRGDVCDMVIKQEIDAMEQEMSAKSQSGGFLDVLRDSKLLLPLVIVCAYQGGQQLSGINAIFYYSVSIFRKAGLSLKAAEYANLGAGSLNLATSLLGPMLMARYNRRSLMLFSTFFCSIFLFLLAIMLYFSEQVPIFATGCIGCIFLYIFFFQFGVGPIPFFIGAELFEVSPRPVAMSLGSLASWGCNFLIGIAFPSLQNMWGALVFLPFSATCAVLFLLTKFYLPETRGRDPSEIAPIMSNGFKSKVR